jgi:hypothetical protein
LLHHGLAARHHDDALLDQEQEAARVPLPEGELDLLAAVVRPAAMKLRRSYASWQALQP